MSELQGAYEKARKLCKEQFYLNRKYQTVDVDPFDAGWKNALLQAFKPNEEVASLTAQLAAEREKVGKLEGLLETAVFWLAERSIVE